MRRLSEAGLDPQPGGTRFGELLQQRLAGLEYRLIGSILDELGRPSRDLPKMVQSGELDFCYMSTVRFTQAAPELSMLELPFLVKDRKAVYARSTELRRSGRSAVSGKTRRSGCSASGTTDFATFRTASVRSASRRTAGA